MRLVCPECKNDVDLSGYPEVGQGTVLECNFCGITLEVSEVGEELSAEVIDEGK